MTDMMGDMPSWAAPDGPWCLKAWLPIPGSRYVLCLREPEHSGHCRDQNGAWRGRHNSMFLGDQGAASKKETQTMESSLTQEKPLHERATPVQMTFRHPAQVLIHVEVEDDVVTVESIHILPAQDKVSELWEGPSLPDGSIHTVSVDLAGDDPDGWVTKARELGFTAVITRIQGPGGWPTVDVTGEATALTAFLADTYVANAVEAAEFITDHTVHLARAWLNEHVWPPLRGLPDDVVWEG